MSDYSQINDYSAKDALLTGNPLKLIKGTDIDAELNAISVAIATKFDSTSIASAGEAQAGVSNTVVMTPGRVTSWGQNAAGVIEDLQALAAPGADRILFWDHSALTTTFLTVGATLAITDTTLDVQTGAGGGASADLVLTAGVGLSGGGDLTANRTFDLEFTELTGVAAILTGDLLAFADISDTNAIRKITFGELEAALSLANQIGTVLTAGTALSYSVGGTKINETSTIDLDITELAAETSVDTAADHVVMYDADAAAHVKVLAEDFVGAEIGDGKWYRNATQALGAATEATVAFNAAEYDSLTRGTFSTGTGQYTATVATRVHVVAMLEIADMNDDESLQIHVQVGGVDKLTQFYYNDTDGDAPRQGIMVAGNVSLSATDVLRIRAETSSAETIKAGTALTNVSITELA